MILYYDVDEVDGILLGDSGYALEAYLMVPFLNPATPAQERFNNSLVKTRVFIEQVNGIVKNRFPCLRYLCLTPQWAVQVTVTSCVLHNVALELGDMMDAPPEVAEGDIIPPPAVGPAGRIMRDHIVATYFA